MAATGGDSWDSSPPDPLSHASPCPSTPPLPRSDFESDDDQPKKPVPEWARGKALMQQLIAQMCVGGGGGRTSAGMHCHLFLAPPSVTPAAAAAAAACCPAGMSTLTRCSSSIRRPARWTRCFPATVRCPVRRWQPLAAAAEQPTAHCNVNLPPASVPRVIARARPTILRSPPLARRQEGQGRLQPAH